MGERAGRLSERVRFEGRDEARARAGNLPGAWAYRFERWARVELLARADPLPAAADTRHSARRWRLTIRDGLRPTLEMRALWRGASLTLTGIEADPASPGWLTIWAEDRGEE
ncbi:head-tail adaptor protein [Sandaracinobacter sp. RS1-74]|uniref:phage head completion protein n=1 Tax=Sandaracinobacteroides sayramensis TaxID=2913411 RepID=UPI001EDAAB6A|nr:head-tail adaptor protein [Sandaracinobacteroides sayramensis]MCG2839761.1 head-tail adaptor protein [Sandaracinobacteroides sayramensis]